MTPAELVPVPYTWVLALSAVLFAIGVVGVLLRRNGIAIFLSLEIMLNSANLAFAAFAYRFAATQPLARPSTGRSLSSSLLRSPPQRPRSVWPSLLFSIVSRILSMSTAPTFFAGRNE